MLQMFELRKMLMKYYIKCILYYVLKHAKLAEWTTLFLATTQVHHIYKKRKSVSFCHLLKGLLNY